MSSSPLRASIHASLAPLDLTLDPAEVREAARLWCGRNRYGIALRPVQLTVGLVYMALGIAGLVLLRPVGLANMPAITITTLIVLGTVSALQGIGRFDFLPRPLMFAALHIGAAALTATDERGRRRTFRWQAVKSVARTADAFVFVLTWRRAIVVPAAVIATHQSELWPQLYGHLVSRRGLTARSPEQVTEIVNTALT